FRVSRLDEFLQLAGEGAKPAPLDGELRWSYRYAWTLQGVHATRAPLKRRATAAELSLERLAEPLAALARRAGGRDRRPLLELAWRTLARCQFHDAIAGCTIDDVARAVDGRLTNVEALARDVVRGAVLDLVHHDPDAARERAGDAAPALVLWNPAARPPGAIRPDRAGEGAVVKGRSLANHWIEIVLEPTGALAVHDRRTGERFFDVLRLEDGGDAGDTYTYCPPVRDRIVRAAGPIRVRRLAAGPLVAALEATFALRAGKGVTQLRQVNSVTQSRPGRVEVRLVVMLHADSPVVRCILDLDNQATWHRLRARVPTDLTGVPAVAGAAFGSVARPPVVVRAAEYPLETPV